MTEEYKADLVKLAEELNLSDDSKNVYIGFVQHYMNEGMSFDAYDIHSTIRQAAELEARKIIRRIKLSMESHS